MSFEIHSRMLFRLLAVVLATVLATVLAGASGPAAAQESRGRGASSGAGVGPGTAAGVSQFTAEVGFTPRGNLWWPVTSSAQDITYSLRNTGTAQVSGELTVLVDQMFDRQTRVGQPRPFTLAPGQTLTGAVRAEVAPLFVMRPTLSVDGGEGPLRVEVSPDTPQWVVPWAAVGVPLLAVVVLVASWNRRRESAVAGGEICRGRPESGSGSGPGSVPGAAGTAFSAG
ncbi:MAG: hypothetical protein LKG15_03825 [Corynebacterium provencense]|uniref:hypothetical protein n=1 Tax=Corynebacterium provencense TaxID=1737425 RepID=UPI002989C80E|nr:hypothetical protein [Corynebacterium provencense]